jgi:hypothetical protein
VYSWLGMDVKSVSHLYKESQSLDIVRALIQGDHTVQTPVLAKVQREQKWKRKSAISIRAAKIAGTILSSREPTIGNVAVVEPPLVIEDTQRQNPQPPRSPLHTTPGDLDLPLHPHPIVKPGPQSLQVKPIPQRLILSQKCWPSGENLGELFKRGKMKHGLLASASILCRETSSLYCRLKLRASHGGPICGTFLVMS